jgi:hypothetical protein
MTEKKDNFYATYFSKDTVLKFSRWAGIFAWVVLAIYGAIALNSFIQFMTQFMTGVFYQKGMSVFDLISFFTPYPVQLAPGITSFFGLKFVQHACLILMDIEESTRRSTREK